MKTNIVILEGFIVKYHDGTYDFNLEIDSPNGNYFIIRVDSDVDKPVFDIGTRVQVIGSVSWNNREKEVTIAASQVTKGVRE